MRWTTISGFLSLGAVLGLMLGYVAGHQENHSVLCWALRIAVVFALTGLFLGALRGRLLARNERRETEEAIRRTLGEELDQRSYFVQRLLPRVESYRRNANLNRRLYYLLTATSIASAAAVPVLITLGSTEPLDFSCLGIVGLAEVNATDLATVLSLLVTILVSLESLFHFREHWRNYDLAEEDLRRQMFLFRTHSGIYKGMVPPADFILLANKVEEIIKTERQNTIQMRTADPGTANLPDAYLEALERANLRDPEQPPEPEQLPKPEQPNEPEQAPEPEQPSEPEQSQDSEQQQGIGKAGDDAKKL